MKNLFLVPTDKPSRLYEGNLGEIVTIQFASAQLKKPLNIYITNSEEIREGDFYLYCNQVTKRFRKNPRAEYPYPNYQKIILTTDQDLIKDGVQEIDNEFLEWFVKNPTCEYAHIGFIAHNDIREYKIIIPQEEPKQETLEEAAERLVPEASCELNNSEASYWQQGWIAGVKWQVEQIPSIIEQYLETAFISKEQGYKNPKDWFEQFKNK
jgi:hypothetical protein